jgi:L-cysteine desulfidase
MAAALGMLVGDPELELQVLKPVNKTNVSEAKDLLTKIPVHTEVKRGKKNIYVEVQLKTSNGTSKAIIADTHTNIILLEVNDNVLFKKLTRRRENRSFNITTLKLDVLIDFIKMTSYKEIAFVLDAVRMNKELAKVGLTGRYGMGAGAALSKIFSVNNTTDKPSDLMQILVASACDARLGGAQKPAMSIAGSGCHGVTATLPVVVMAEHLHAGKDELARAIALSFLITIYIKSFSGRLSAFCGCAVTAAAGAAAGLTYLQGGGKKQIYHTIENLAADITGIICDGGNFGCALKTSTGAATALSASQLALNGSVIPSNSGIIGSSIEETVRNMGRISSPGMVKTDEEILSIIEHASRI